MNRLPKLARDSRLFLRRFGCLPAQSVLCRRELAVSVQSSQKYHLNKQLCENLSGVPTLRTRAMSDIESAVRDDVDSTRCENLGGKEDAYNGIIVDASNLPSDVDAFRCGLREALQEWKSQGRRGIWIRIPLDRAHFVGPAVEAGFVFHHAEAAYVMMTQWLPNSDNKLPPNASHQVGIGAFVLNEKNEVLVVQEGTGPLKGKGVWKMPTGIVMAGEDLSEAAEREVLEETGIRATFDCVLAMRQAHGVAFDKSDMFVAVALRPEPGQEQLTIQEDELEAAAWMPLEEFEANTFMRSRPLWSKVLSLCMAWADGSYSGLPAHKVDNGFNGREDLLICGELQSPAGSTQPPGRM